MTAHGVMATDRNLVALQQEYHALFPQDQPTLSMCQHGVAHPQHLRSLLWKVYLDVLPTDATSRSRWVATLMRQRAEVRYLLMSST